MSGAKPTERTSLVLKVHEEPKVAWNWRRTAIACVAVTAALAAVGARLAAVPVVSGVLPSDGEYLLKCDDIPRGELIGTQAFTGCQMSFSDKKEQADGLVRPHAITDLLERANVFIIGDSTSKLNVIHNCAKLVPPAQRCTVDISSPTAEQCPPNMRPFGPDPGPASAGGSCCNGQDCCMKKKELQTAAGCQSPGAGTMGYAHVAAFYKDYREESWIHDKAEGIICNYTGYDLTLQGASRFRKSYSWFRQFYANRDLPTIVVLDVNLWLRQVDVSENQWKYITDAVKAVMSEHDTPHKCLMWKTQPEGLPRQNRIMYHNYQIRRLGQKFGIAVYDWGRVFKKKQFSMADMVQDMMQCHPREHTAVAMLEGMNEFTSKYMQDCVRPSTVYTGQ